MGDSTEGGGGGGGETVSSSTKPQQQPPIQSAIVYDKPGWFADLGKHARDLLYKGFSSASMLSVSCLGPRGLFLSSSATIIDGAVLGLMSTSFKNSGVQSELSGNTLSQIVAGTTYDDIAPGLKVAFTTTLPGADELGKAQIHYLTRNAALDATVFGFKSKPLVQVSANIGSQRLSLGCSSLYNSETKEIAAASLGLGYLKPDFSLAFLYDPFKENKLDTYFTYILNPTTTVAGHMNYKFEKQVTTTSFGGSHRLDAYSTLKARLDNTGLLSALLEHQPSPFVTFGLYADIDTSNLQNRKPNVGVTVSILGAVA